MRRMPLPVLLGLCHAVADGASGLLLGSLALRMDLTQVGLLVLLYNALAFGLQPVIGLAADRLGRPRWAAVAGLLLVAAGVLTGGLHDTLAVVLAGLGSASFHVGGGALSLCATPDRATGPGFFAAPGVIGLAIGGALAMSGHQAGWVFFLLLLPLTAAVAAARLPALPYGQPSRDEPALDAHDLIMAALLGAIALRSAVWVSAQYLLDGQVGALLAVAAAAAIGKLLGGLLADRFGWRRWAVGALAVSAGLLTAGGESLYTLLPGIALLQSATPVTLVAARRLLPGLPATASGLTLGLAIALGGLPLAMGANAPPRFYPLLLALACAALWWALRPRAPGQVPGALPPQSHT